MINVNEELAVAASQWMLNDFPVVPPPKFSDKL